EKLEVEVRRGMVRAVRAVVAPREEGPVLVANLASDEAAQANAGIVDPAALLAYLLALCRGQLGQELLEGRVAAILPAELHRPPQPHPGGFHFPRLALAGEEHVQRRRIPREVKSCANQERPGRAVARKQPRPRYRREGHRAQELRVVVD